MKEIEIKILNIDVEDTVRKLLELGAKKVYEGDIKVIYFDFKNNELQKQDKRLRLRDFGSKIELTFKKKLSNVKTKIADEFEVEVSNYDEAYSICEGLGLKQCKEYVKNRVSYRLPGVSFEFDTLKDCPTFLEIEAESEDAVFEWVEKLGFNKDKALPLSGSEVLEIYKK